MSNDTNAQTTATDEPINAANPDPNAGSDENKSTENEPKTEVTDAAKDPAKGMQRRIDRLTREKYELKARLDANSQNNDRQFNDDRSDEEKSIDKEVAAAREEGRRQALMETQTQSFNKRCDSIFSDGVKEIGEQKFQSAVAEVAAEFGADKRAYSEFLQTVVDFDSPHKILAHLGSNSDELAEIIDLSPRQQIRALAKLELTLASKPKKTSQAPEPISGLGNAGAVSDPLNNAQKLTDAQWWAEMQKNRKK